MSGAERPIPGPDGHPLLGMAGELRSDLLGTLYENFNRYGDLVRYRVGPARGPRALRRDVVAVHHPDGVRRVLSDERTFTRRTASFGVLGELFGENIVTATGDAWRRQRNTLSPLFTPAQVRRHAAAMGAEARAVVGSVPASCDVVDIAKLMERYTVRVLGRTLFGGGQGIDQVAAGALSRLVPRVGTLVQSRAGAAVRVPLGCPTAANRRFVKTRVELYQTIDRLLARRNGRGLADGDLVAVLEAARDPDTGAPLSGQEIRGQALIFLLAGHTTTTSALTSTVYLLASHPEVQERVAAAAADSALPGGGSDPVAAAVREGLRLHPPAHVIGRRVLEDAEIDGHAIAAGTSVLVSPWVTHRHPGFWDEPQRFNPDRFLSERRAQYAYFPFGGGGRVCIGRHFALQEVTTMVRELLVRYKLEALDDELPSAQLITLRPAGPVRVRCQRR